MGKTENGIDGSLGFLVVDADQGEGRLSALDQASGVDGPEGALKVRAGAEICNGVLGKMAANNYLQGTRVGEAMLVFCAGGTTIALAADLDFGGLVLTESLDEES